MYIQIQMIYCITYTHTGGLDLLSQTKYHGLLEYFCEGGKRVLDDSKLCFEGGKGCLIIIKGS